MFKRIFITALLAIAVIIPSAGYAAGDIPNVRAFVDRRVAAVGDRIRYRIEVKSPKGMDIVFPKFQNNMIGAFEIKDSSRTVKKGFFGNTLSVQRYWIASYTIGMQPIPAVEVKYKSKGSEKWESVQTNPFDITIESVLSGDNSNDIRDIKEPIGFFEINYFLVFIIVVVLAGVTFVFIAFKNRKNKVPLKMAHETALEELEALKAAYARGGDVKDYFAGISDCVRRYIERVFRLKAPEMTTEEFLDSLRDSAVLGEAQKELLKDFLKACDLVKFAKYLPARGEVELVFDAAKRFVEETRNIAILHSREGKV